MLYICIYVAPWSCEARHLVPLYVHTCSGMTIKLNLNLNLNLNCFISYLGLCTFIYIAIYSFSRSFYPKRLTIEEYNKRYIIKSKQTQEVLVIQHFRHCSELILARQGEVKEREQRFFIYEEKGAEVK